MRHPAWDREALATAAAAEVPPFSSPILLSLESLAGRSPIGADGGEDISSPCAGVSVWAGETGAGCTLGGRHSNASPRRSKAAMAVWRWCGLGRSEMAAAAGCNGDST